MEKLRHSHGSSNTMKNMLARLRELKRQAKREHAATKPQPKPEPVEYHGANETLVREGQAAERHEETVQIKWEWERSFIAERVSRRCLSTTPFRRLRCLRRSRRL